MLVRDRRDVLVLPAFALAAAALSGCIDDPEPATPLSCDTPVTAFYVIDDFQIPRDSDEGEAYGADLDGDGTTDNQMGSVASVVLQLIDDPTAVGWRTQMDERLADGLSTRLMVERCPAGDQRVTLADSTLPVSALFDFVGGTADEWWALSSTQIDLEIDGGEATGLLRGGVAAGYEEPLAETMVPLVELLRAHPDPTIAENAERIDTNDDGVISAPEVRASVVFQTLFRADLDTNDDGSEDALSIGVAFHARAI